MNRQELVEKMDEELRMGRGMEGVLSVAIEEITLIVLEQRCERGNIWDSAIMACNREIRAQLERVKTPEERVTVGPPTERMRETFWKVYLDGIWKANLHSSADAEIYRLGLIQRLKEQLPKNQ